MIVRLHTYTSTCEGHGVDIDAMVLGWEEHEPTVSIDLVAAYTTSLMREETR